MRFRFRNVTILVVSALACLTGMAPGALAQTLSGCAMVSQPFQPPLIQLAAAKPASGEIAITYIGHATFLLETAAGVTAATDYNDYVRPAAVPVIATMNRAHSTHFSLRPDPGIAHVLRGWSEGEAQAQHDLQVRDLRVRNVATNIRNVAGGTAYNGNSIFIFESAGLCIAHLGHLHHTLSPQKLAEIGRIDVLFVPVDGAWTMDQDGMLEVLDAIHPRMVIPMHYFSRSTLERFLERMGARYAVRRAGGASIIVSQPSLPEKPELVVLEGR